MTVYRRLRVVKVRYYPWLRPWYAWLDWYQGNDIAARFWTSRTGRFLCWSLPKLIVLLWFAIRVFGFLIVVVGSLVLYSVVNMGLGGGAMHKGLKSAR